jgi:predicted  nucleic acid-binding Zn-ribbon protein
MAKVVIAELDIDIQALLKTTSDLKKEIDKIKNSQKELAASGEGASEAFIENEAVLKTLTGAYSQNIKAIQESGKATAQQTDQTELLNLALTQEATSISEAREQNKLLNKLRNETNTTTKEGQAQLTALNAKLDANNEYIKENADQYLKQKINIGNYSESVKDALASLNPFNGGLSGFTQRAQEAGGAGNLLKNAFMQITTGIYGMVKSSLAFIATPIGAIIAAIVVVATTMYNIFKSFTPIVDKVEQIFAGLSATLSVVKNTIISLVTGAQSLGSAFSSLSGDMDKAYDSAVALKQAQQDLDDAMQATELSSAKARAEINKLNIQAKDRTKTEAERLALLQRAENLEKTVFNNRKANAVENLRIAKEQIRINLNASNQEIANLETNFVKTKEALEKKGTNVDQYTDAYISAQKALYEIDNESTSNLEKNINKQNKLIDDAEAKQEKANAVAEARRQKQAEARQKAIDDSILKQEQELTLLAEKNRFEEDELVKAQTLAVKENEILKDKLNKKKISQTEYDAETLRIQNDLTALQNQKDADELQRLKDFEDRKRNLQNEIALQNATTEAEKESIKLSQDLEKQLLELENIQATETEKNELRKLIMEQYYLDVAQITEDAAVKQMEKQRDFDMQEIEYQKAKQEAMLGLAQQLAAGLIGVLGDSLAGQLAAIALDAVIQIAKVRIATASAKAINTAAGTAASIPTFGASVIAANAQNVALEVQSKIQQGNILKSSAVSAGLAVARKFEKGGIQEIGGKRHSAGGTKFYGEDGTMFEAERGEGIGILNRGAYSAFMNFNNQFGSGKSGGGMFAGGGIITQGVKPETMDLNMIVGAIQQLPAPVVAVEEIQTVGQRYVSVKANADF